MVGFLGWIGFLLLIFTYVPFALRRFGLWRNGLSFFALHHHSIALSCFTVLTLHGIWALIGRRGWGWRAKLHFEGAMLSGGITWLILLAVVVLAISLSRQRPLLKIHCLVVILLVLLVLNYVF